MRMAGSRRLCQPIDMASADAVAALPTFAFEPSRMSGNSSLNSFPRPKTVAKCTLYSTTPYPTRAAAPLLLSVNVLNTLPPEMPILLTNTSSSSLPRNSPGFTRRLTCLESVDAISTDSSEDKAMAGMPSSPPTPSDSAVMPSPSDKALRKSNSVSVLYSAGAGVGASSAISAERSTGEPTGSASVTTPSFCFISSLYRPPSHDTSGK
mmetsp:Transcript_22864/g.50839  ORF Transcript_22864/g.50839 Transcript_22864/m.50839 type:complete len:208 (-) Transcript_22864:721-1344(-)